jgi:hypothetical protein
LAHDDVEGDEARVADGCRKGLGNVSSLQRRDEGQAEDEDDERVASVDEQPPLRCEREQEEAREGERPASFEIVTTDPEPISIAPSRGAVATSRRSAKSTRRAHTKMTTATTKATKTSAGRCSTRNAPETASSPTRIVAGRRRPGELGGSCAGAARRAGAAVTAP